MPLRVPWHYDGVKPCLADQTQPFLSMQDSMVMKRDAQMSNLVTETNRSNMVTEIEKSNLLMEIEMSDMVTDSKCYCNVAHESSAVELIDSDSVIQIENMPTSIQGNFHQANDITTGSKKY